MTSEPTVVCCPCWRPQPAPLTAPVRDLQGAPADDHTAQSLPLIPALAQACLSLQVLTHSRCVFFPSSRDPHQMLTYRSVSWAQSATLRTSSHGHRWQVALCGRALLTQP